MHVYKNISNISRNISMLCQYSAVVPSAPSVCSPHPRIKSASTHNISYFHLTNIPRKPPENPWETRSKAVLRPTYHLWAHVWVHSLGARLGPLAHFWVHSLGALLSPLFGRTFGSTLWAHFLVHSLGALFGPLFGPTFWSTLGAISLACSLNLFSGTLLEHTVGHW